MATTNDPKTADDGYQNFNVATAVFDIGENTTIGGGFSTLKSKDVTIKISVRKFGEYKLKWDNGLRIGISVSKPDGTQVFTQQLDNILSYVKKHIDYE